MCVDIDIFAIDHVRNAYLTLAIVSIIHLELSAGANHNAMSDDLVAYRRYWAIRKIVYFTRPHTTI